MVNFRERLAEIDREMRKKLADPEHAIRCQRIEESLAADGEVQKRHRRKNAGIPAAFWAGLDAPKETPAREFIASWLASPKLVAVMAGELGVGKSFAMAEAIDKRGGSFVEASDICRSGWYNDEKWDDWRLAPLLALDELGMEPMDEKGWWEGKLFRLLSGRLNDNRRTILATNLSKEDLRKRYGSEAMSRLWDRLEANWAGKVFRGPSLRKAAP